MSAQERRRRWFLCDMENVHSRWASVLPYLEPGDAIVLFLSNVTGRPDMNLLAAPETSGTAFYFEKCETGRPNAMDFQIMCELGRLSVLHPGDEFFIVSDDKGYQSVTDYMKRHGTLVACLGTDANGCGAPAIPELLVPPDPPAGSASYNLKKSYRKMLEEAGVPESDLFATTGIFYAAMAEPQNARKLSVLNRLRQQYGSAEGQLRYTAIKDLVHKIADEGPWPPASEAVKKDPDPGDVNLVLGAAHVPLQKGMVTKICAAIREARKKPKHQRNDLEKRLKSIVGLDRALPAARALEQFLREPAAGTK